VLSLYKHATCSLASFTSVNERALCAAVWPYQTTCFLNTLFEPDASVLRKSAPAFLWSVRGQLSLGSPPDAPQRSCHNH